VAVPYPVSFRNLVVGALGPSKPPARFANTLGASLAMALMGLPAEFSSKGIESVFGKKREVIEDNEKIVKSGYEFVKTHNNVNIKELPVREGKERYMLTGNEAIGIGKVIGGLKLQTYYPITPAADESFFLEGHDYFEPEMGEDIDKENEVSEEYRRCRGAGRRRDCRYCNGNIGCNDWNKDSNGYIRSRLLANGRSARLCRH